MTRLAASEPGMWTDILLDNADRIGPAVDRLLEVLSGAREALERGHETELRRCLERARSWSRGEL